MRTKEENVTLMVICLLILGMCGYAAGFVQAENDCDNRHGVLVRGLVWFECVQPPAKP